MKRLLWSTALFVLVLALAYIASRPVALPALCSIGLFCPDRVAQEEAAMFAVDDAASFGEELPVEHSYQLLGVSPQHGALIRGADQQRYYQTGDRLADSSVVVAHILPDGVLLNDRGSYALLWLHRGVDAGEQFRYRRLPWLTANTDSVAQRYRLIDLRADERAGRLAGEYRERLYRQPLSLLGEIDIRMDKDETGDRRVWLRPGRDHRVFSTWRLRDGDEVLGLNGIPVSELDAFYHLYEQMAAATHLVATLRRDGETLVVLISLES